MVIGVSSDINALSDVWNGFDSNNLYLAGLPLFITDSFAI
jgi:hypothetical protein